MLSRAQRTAAIFPSMPRLPKPPGTRTPSAPSSSSAAFPSVTVSESTQRMLHLYVVLDAPVGQGLRHRQIGVVERPHICQPGRSPHCPCGCLARVRPWWPTPSGRACGRSVPAGGPPRRPGPPVPASGGPRTAPGAVRLGMRILRSGCCRTGRSFSRMLLGASARRSGSTMTSGWMPMEPAAP